MSAPAAAPGAIVRYGFTVEFSDNDSDAKQRVIEAAKVPEENIAFIVYTTKVELSASVRHPAKVGGAFEFPSGEAPDVQELKSRLEAVEGAQNVRISVTTR